MKNNINSNKPTDQQTLVALDKSIAKWKAIVNGSQATEVVFQPKCALCQLEKKYNSRACSTCIIAIKSNSPYCDKTPFYQTSDWKSYREKNSVQPNKADNEMLLMLYSIRREFVVKMARNNFKRNHENA